MSTATLPRRWLIKLSVGDGCWEWQGVIVRGGYGAIDDGKGVKLFAHRVAYELLVGPIPAGLQLDHLCRNTRCVRPDHLEAVTPRENYLRGVGFVAQNARKTHCPQRHEYDEANTYVYRGMRYCRECQRERKRKAA